MHGIIFTANLSSIVPSLLFALVKNSSPTQYFVKFKHVTLIGCGPLAQDVSRPFGTLHTHLLLLTCRICSVPCIKLYVQGIKAGTAKKLQNKYTYRYTPGYLIPRLGIPSLSTSLSIMQIQSMRNLAMYDSIHVYMQHRF